MLCAGTRIAGLIFGSDVADAAFGFCGHSAHENSPYCAEHARVAYQPAQTKKRSGANELARSLRRYI